MKENSSNFENDGFLIIDNVFSLSEIKTIESKIAGILDEGVGTRNMLKLDWVGCLADKLEICLSIEKYLSIVSVPG